MAEMTSYNRKPAVSTKEAVDKLKTTISAPSVQEQFRNALKENSGIFVSSLIGLFTNDRYLRECDPNLVIMEALKAATLKLGLDKSLGYAYIVAYKGKPQFQIGYKGLIQLALRSGAYKNIHADAVYEGEFKSYDKLTGNVDISGVATSDKVVGYFAHIELTTGFVKTLYWSEDKVKSHAQRYSQNYKPSDPNNIWSKNFDEMAIKTVLRNLLAKYGIMSIEMVQAVTAETDTDETGDVVDIDLTGGGAIDENGEVIEGEIVDEKPKQADF